MEKLVAQHKNVVFRTRDLIAESQANDGTAFDIQLRSGAPDGAEAWWRTHLLDNDRQVFRAGDDERTYLSCHDETECAALMQSIQRSLNEVLV